jgi:hypothetical protein
MSESLVILACIFFSKKKKRAAAAQVNLELPSYKQFYGEKLNYLTTFPSKMISMEGTSVLWRCP